MSTDATVSAGEGTQQLPRKPRLLTWRRAKRERRLQERMTRSVIRTFARGE